MVRVVVHTGGVEHVLSAVYVQWLSSPDRQSSAVTQTRRLEDIGFSSCGAITGESEFTFSITCSVAHGPDDALGKTYRFDAKVGQPGELSVRRSGPL
jgi:hypothetical protein